MGDGAIVEFSSVVAAVECAVSLQQRLLAYNASFDEAERLQFRIGINSGDVISQGDDLYGEGVNVAARLESIADIGGVCVSGTVFDQVRTKVDFSFVDLGEQALKNIEEPIRAFRILVGQNGGTTTRQSTGARVMDLLPQQKPSIALLPFEDLTPDNESSYLADGMRLGIQAGLVLLPGLFLINAPAVKPFGDHRISEAEAARALGVRYLLGGAVQRAGQRMRATFQLTDTKNGEIVWSERYDRDLTDIFELQDEITREVLVSLNVRVMGRDVTRFWFRRLTHPKARELFMHGNFHLYSGGAQHNEEARRIFEQLHDLDPDVGHGSGAVALTHWLDAFFGWSESPERSRELARQWATTAIAYSEADGFGHAVLGHLQLYDRAFDAALDKCRMAVALRSSCPLAFGLLASVQVYCGDNRSAIKNAHGASAGTGLSALAHQRPGLGLPR